MLASHRTRDRRAGFTLVELLIVLSLMIILAALTVGIANSGLVDSYKVVGSGDRISGWLILAKSKAQREGAPRGVRFIQNSSGHFTEAQYIEAPDPYFPITPNAVANQKYSPPLLTITQNGAARTLMLEGNSGNTTTIAAVQSNVSKGDTLYLPEFNLLCPLTADVPAAGNLTVSNASAIDMSSGNKHSTTTFGFYRAPRPMLGEANLLLPQGMIIDLQPAGRPTTSLISPTNGEFDVLFAPNGEVMNAGNAPQIVLWVRNTSYLPASSNPRDNLTAAGEMVLVVVYTKTGAISTQPVLMPPNDVYGAVKDGVNSGL